MKCPVKGCRDNATENHHIVYGENEVVKGLCGRHHLKITCAQSHQARKQRHELSQKQRWLFWYKLLDGELERVRVTNLDLEWIKK